MLSGKKGLFIILTLYLVIQILTFRTGLGFEDFRDTQIFRQVNSGLVPYKDILWDYGPLGVYLWAFFIKIFGSELIILRLFAILLGAIGIIFVYDISKKIMTRGLSLLAAFLSFATFNFPSYNLNHYLSVLTLVITIRYAYRFFCDKKKTDLFMWGIFLAMTFYIRPIPTGIALTASSMLIIIVASIKDKNGFVILMNFIFLLAFLIVMAVTLYFITEGRYTLMSMAKYAFMYQKISDCFPILRLPNTIGLGLNFIHALKTFNITNLNTFYYIISFFNLISGHFVYWFVFIAPSIYFIIYFIKVILKRKLRELNKKDYLIIFLCCLNFSLCFYFHNMIIGSDWPDLGNNGTAWLFEGGQFLLQPGIIVSIYLLSQVHMRWRKPFLAKILLCILALSIIFPKILNLRYMILKMPVSRTQGIRGIYLNNFYEKAVIPTVDFLNSNKNIPEYLFICGYFPAFYVLTNKKPVIPETIGITFFLSPEYGMEEDKKYIFPSKSKKLLSKEDLYSIILERLQDKRPCVITFGEDPFSADFKWISFIKNNYYPVKTFTYKRTLTGYVGNDPRITIYLPKDHI